MLYQREGSARTIRSAASSPPTSIYSGGQISDDSSEENSMLDGESERESSNLSAMRKNDDGSNGGGTIVSVLLSLPPQHRRLIYMVCILLTVATTFNVATVAYSFHEKAKGVRDATDSNGNKKSLRSDATYAEYHAAAVDRDRGSMFQVNADEGLEDGKDMATNPNEGQESKEKNKPRRDQIVHNSRTENHSNPMLSEEDRADGKYQNKNPLIFMGEDEVHEKIQKNPLVFIDGDAEDAVMAQQEVDEDELQKDGIFKMLDMERVGFVRSDDTGADDNGTMQKPQGEDGLQNDKKEDFDMEVFKIMSDQQSLIAQMQEQLLQQNEMMKQFHEVQLQQTKKQQQDDIQQPVEPQYAAREQQGQLVPASKESSPASEAGQVSSAQSTRSPELAGYKDVWDEHSESDVPVFWHIPKAGGSTVKDIMGTCHRFCMASEAGITEGHDKDTEIAIVHIGGDPANGQDPSPFVNVDATTVEGLKRAKRLGLAQSGLSDAVITPFIFEANDIFDPQHRGRLFTVFRHPVDRAVSMFFYLQVATWEPTYSPEFAQMSIADYARSPHVENNWMTRFLSNQEEGDLTDNNLEIAMDVIRRKFLVGLLSRKEETMERFEKYFKWKYYINPKNQEKCREKLLGSGANSNSKNKKEKPSPGDEAYELLAWQNQYDIPLYEYIESLFEEQASFVAAIPDGYRLEGATCCKCEQPPTC